MSVSVIVPAYNEAQNIVTLLNRILEDCDAGCPIDDITVVASGCTDETATLARDVASAESVVRVLEQPLREGKASAINLGLVNAKNDVIVLISGDVLPDLGAIAALVTAMGDEAVGVAGARPVPRNDARAFTGFAAQMMWRLHHRINEHTAEPKCGEMIAFRRALNGRALVTAIPVDSAVDEVSIQSLINDAGLRSIYVPSAIVRNWGPATVRDWARQRRRINAGHLLSAREGYRPSTTRAGGVIKAMLTDGASWRRPHFAASVVALEIAAHAAAHLDVARGKGHAVWSVASSTKRPFEGPA